MYSVILVSACLVGEKCKYNGGDNFHPQIAELVRQGKAIAVCPEVLGGLSTPRLPCEICGGDGHAVLDGKAVVKNNLGEDVTEAFISGAHQVLQKALANNAAAAILKERSPSCGVHKIYDGSFNAVKINGQGVLAALLKRNGITLYSEEDAHDLF